MSTAWLEWIPSERGLDGAVLHLTGELDIALAARVRVLASEAIGRRPTFLRVDFTEVDYMSEHGLAALCSCGRAPLASRCPSFSSTPTVNRRSGCARPGSRITSKSNSTLDPARLPVGDRG